MTHAPRDRFWSSGRASSWMVRRFPALMALIAAVFLVVGVPLPAAADEDLSDFTFASFEADYILGRDADGRAQMHVVEVYRPVFPAHDQNRGLTIQLIRSESGVDYGTRVLQVTDADGGEVPWWVEEDGDSLVVLTGDDTYLHGEQSYRVVYEMTDVVRDFADTRAQEFYWDLWGAQNPQPLGSVTARLHVPDELAGALKEDALACYGGGAGSHVGCTITAGPAELPAEAESWWAARGLDAASALTITADIGALPGEQGATIAVGFIPGTFTAPAVAPFPGAAWVPGVFGAALGVCALPILLWARRRLRRNPDPGPVVVQYTPPEGVSVLRSAVVLDRRDRALAAHVVDLAVRGILEIRLRTEGAGHDLVLRDREAAAGDDRRLVNALFGRKATTGAVQPVAEIAELGGRMSGYAERLRTAGEKSGLRATAPAWAAWLRGGLLVGSLLSVILLFALGDLFAGDARLGSTGFWVYLSLLALSVVGVVASIFVSLPATVLTADGGRHRTHLDGMREYIGLAEVDRLRAAQGPETAELSSGRRRPYGEPTGAASDRVVHVYERLLPYAVLFGQEDEWVGVLGQVLPAATAGSAVWTLTTDPVLFAASRAAGRQSTVAPGAGGSSGGVSSSGGSSGGGFVGGGGGGGSIGGR